MRRVIELNTGDINVINGPDEMLICGLTMGADAGIGSIYNIMPEKFVKLYGASGPAISKVRTRCSMKSIISWRC